MILVISPAKALDYETPPTTATFTQPDFLDHAAELIEVLREKSPAQIAELMSLSDQLSSLNVARYASWSRPFAPDNAKQALLAFDGDVYEGLDAKSLADDDLAWAQDHGVDWHYIAPGKPTQNGFVESFNGRMRDELLNESLFFSLDHARQKVAAWALDYNTRRPHSSIGYLTPEAFAASLTATGRPAAQDESCAVRPVAHPTLRGVTNPRTLVAAG